MTDYKTIAESNNFILLDKYNKEWKVAENYQSEDSLERELIFSFPSSSVGMPTECEVYTPTRECGNEKRFNEVEA